MTIENNVRAKARTNLLPKSSSRQNGRLFFEIPYGRNEVSPGSEQNEPTRAKPVRRILLSAEEFQIERIR